MLYIIAAIHFLLPCICALPVPDSLAFQTNILEKNDTLCNNTEFRCIIVDVLPHDVASGLVQNNTFLATTLAAKSGTSKSSSSTSSSNADDDKQDEDKQDNDDIVHLTPAFMYTGLYEIPEIVKQFLTQTFPNETFMYLNDATHQTRRRRSSPYSWDWSSNVNCQTTQTKVNLTAFTTTCANSGTITQTNYCFSGDMTTIIEVNGTYQNIPLKNLEQYYGNKMITFHDKYFFDGSSEKYQDTYPSTTQFMTFVHIDHTVTTSFLEIVLNTTSLTVTGNHLVYKVRDNCKSYDKFLFEDCGQRVFSHSLTVGDSLFVHQSSKLIGETNKLEIRQEKIVAINNVVRTGIYSPMPKHGSKFFVNNVLVSPFSSTDFFLLNSLHYTYAWLISHFN